MPCCRPSPAALTALTGAAPGESDTVVDVERVLDGDPRDWDEEEVQTWFETHNRGQWVEYASKFKGLSGQQMSAFTKDDFLLVVDPPFGSAIYNDWQALLNPSTRTLSCCAVCSDGRDAARARLCLIAPADSATCLRVPQPTRWSPL